MDYATTAYREIPPGHYHATYDMHPDVKESARTASSTIPEPPIAAYGGVQWEAKVPAQESTFLVSDEGGAASKGKVKLEPRFFRGLLAWSTLIHAVAFASTAVAFTLNITQWYWADASPSAGGLPFLDMQQTQDALQFVAKLHGNVIVASLSAMILHFVRRMLVGHGVSWGLMAGAYQVGSASWFFSWDFLGPLLAPGRKRNAFLALALALAFFYAVVVGPASAIVIIPRLAWWKVDDPYQAGVGSILTSYAVTPFGEFYPQNLTDIVNPAREDCQVNMASCPGFGFSSIRNLVGEWAMSGRDPAMGIKARASDASRMLRASPMYSVFDKNYVAVASTLTSPLAELAGAFADFVETNPEEAGKASDVLQPRFSPVQDAFAALVQVECTPFSYHEYVETGTGEGVPGFSASGLRNLSLTGSESDAYKRSGRWDLPASQWDVSRDLENLEETTFKFMEVVTGDQETQPSLGALFNIPFARNTTRGLAQDSLIIPCVIDARWAAVDVSYSPRTSNIVGHTLDDLRVLGKFWEKTDAPSLPATFDAQQVRLSTKWANYLNGDLPDPFGNIVERNSVKSLLDFFFGPGGRNEEGIVSFEPPIRRLGKDKDKAVAATVATVLSLVVAEGMARHEFPEQYYARVGLSSNGSTTFAPLWYRTGRYGGERATAQSPDAFESWTPVDWQVERYGWGYSLAPTTTKAAVAILLLHVLLLVVYLAYIIWFRLSPRGWSSTAWSSLPELMAMALLSRQRDEASVKTVLDGGRRIKEPMVRIRTYDGERDDVVIGEPPYEGEPIMRRKKYSAS